MKMNETDLSFVIYNSVKFQAEDSPTKVAWSKHTNKFLDKRKALFSPCIEESPLKRSKTDGDNSIEVSITEESENSCLRINVQEDTMVHEQPDLLWTESETSSSNTALPPLSLAKELPEDVRDALQPTPLAEMLAQDLDAASSNKHLPEDTLMLRVDNNSPWVKHLNLFGGDKVPMIHVPVQQEQQLSRQHSLCHHGRHGMLDETDVVPSANNIISDLEMPRNNSTEENLRQQVLNLLWDVDAMRLSAWDAIDRWHNVDCDYYAARQKITWQKATRTWEEPSPSFVDTILK